MPAWSTRATRDWSLMGARHFYHRVPSIPQKGTPILTLYGGPGTGKSTTAALVFAHLKLLAGRNVELAHEVAKDYTWEGAHGKLAYQPLVTAKQLWSYERLQGKVDLIITDTSPLLALIHGVAQPQTFFDWVLDDYRRRRHINVFLRRPLDRAYNPAGRIEDKQEAYALDVEIRHMLAYHGIDHYEVVVQDDGHHANDILNLLDERVEWS